MSAFLYGVGLQWKLDLRSKSLLITCYAVPLLFFVVMGGVFTSIMPESKETLIQSMTIMGVSMGALVGLPPTLVDLYGSDIKKMYRANGVPLSLGVVSTFLSSFLHLMIMSAIIYIAAPFAFDAALPESPLAYFGALAIFVAASLALGSVLGLLVKQQSKLTMLSQVLFLPSIMLSGIMFPANMLPRALELAGKVCPASWGFLLMQNAGFCFENFWPLLLLFAIGIALCALLLKKIQAE